MNVLFRGRELAHIDEGRKVMEEVLQALEEVGKLEKNPSMEGRRMTAILAPRTSARPPMRTNPNSVAVSGIRGALEGLDRNNLGSCTRVCLIHDWTSGVRL